MKTCPWCGSPANEGTELCDRCSAARQADRQLPARRKESQPSTIGGSLWAFLWALGKAAVAGVLALILLGMGLFGTCSLIVAVGSGNFPTLVMALVGLGAAALLGWLIYAMYQSDLTPQKPNSNQRSAIENTSIRGTLMPKPHQRDSVSPTGNAQTHSADSETDEARSELDDEQNPTQT